MNETLDKSGQYGDAAVPQAEPTQDDIVATGEARPVADEKGIYTLKIGEHIVKVRKLKGTDVRLSNEVSPSDDTLNKMMDRVLFSVCDVDGQPFGPPQTKAAAKIQYAAIASKFEASEYDYLFTAYAWATQNKELEAQAKNAVESLN